jgi:hypothetical protein
MMVIAFSVFYNVTRFFEYRHETFEVSQEVNYFDSCCEFRPTSNNKLKV